MRPSGNFEYYERNGKQYDRVTRILDYFTTPELVKWKIKVGAKEAKRQSTIAINIGTNVDEWIKADILGQKLPRLKKLEENNCVEAYKRWVMDYCIVSKELRVGETVYDDNNYVAGTPDLWLPETCVDIKCSKSIRYNYWLQTNWYAFTKRGIRYKAILRLDKELGTYEYEVREVNTSELDVFYGLLKAYRYFNQESLTEGKGEEDVTDANSTNNETEAVKEMDKPEVSNDRTSRDW